MFHAPRAARAILKFWKVIIVLGMLHLLTGCEASRSEILKLASSYPSCTVLTSPDSVPNTAALIRGITFTESLDDWQPQALLSDGQIATFDVQVGLGGEVGRTGTGSRTMKLEEYMLQQSPTTVVFDRRILHTTRLASLIRAPPLFSGNIIQSTTCI